MCGVDVVWVPYFEGKASICHCISWYEGFLISHGRCKITILVGLCKRRDQFGVGLEWKENRRPL